MPAAPGVTPPRTHRRAQALVAVVVTAVVVTAVVVTALVATACAGGTASPAIEPSASSTGTAPETFAGLRVLDDGDPALPVTVVDATGTEVTVDSTKRIFPANGDLAEVVFALGLGGSVVARDVSATFPPEVETLPSVGYQRTLPVEPIAALEPTVVLASTTAGPPETISALRALAIPVVVLDYPNTLDGPPEKIRALGAVLGVGDGAEAMAEVVEAEVNAATALADQAGEPPGWRRCISAARQCSWCSAPAAG